MQLQRPPSRMIRAKLSEARARKRLVPAQHRSTILLVEDDPDMRRMLAATLRRDGHFVIEAANGEAAFDWLAPGVLEDDLERIPDLVVSDVRLPHYSGLEILEGLQVSRPRIPVILITAFPDQETHDLAARLGAQCVLEKPFELSQLRAAVHLALHTHRPRGAGSDDAAR